MLMLHVTYYGNKSSFPRCFDATDHTEETTVSLLSSVTVSLP